VKFIDNDVEGQNVFFVFFFFSRIFAFLRKKGYLKKGKGVWRKGKNKVWCQSLLQMIFGRFFKERSIFLEGKKIHQKGCFLLKECV